MKLNKLARLIWIIPFLVMGCQQSQLANKKPFTQSHSFSGPVSLRTQTAKDGRSASLRSPSDAGDSESKKCPGSQNPETGITEDDQDKIDQALELCNFAQKMWEEGNLEEALGNLDSAYSLILELDNQASPELSQQKEDLRYLISKRILEIYASRQIVVTGQHEAIPITLNEHVQAEIKRLTGPERGFFTRALERSAQFRPHIVEELKKAGLPEEISWLPLIESGFKLRAMSPARALGLWQFIPSTGHKFGLNRNYHVDERMDPEKSTQAAIAYLKELHNLFGDWTTALAAYNCGEFRVLKTIRKQKINYLDNFWDLYQNLPRETARYVPRFLATVHIINNLSQYGLQAPPSESPIAYKVVDITKQVLLKDIAREIGVETELLKNLNPELRLALLPPETYSLRVPEAKADIFLAKLDKITSTYTPPPMYVYHKIRKGDTLSGIARKYRTSIRAISLCNNISKSYRIIAGKVLKIPARNNQAPGAYQATADPAAPQVPEGKTITYKVTRGDSLWIIANKFSTTTKQIVAQNRLKNSTLFIGQQLSISAPEKAEEKTGSATYQVRSGDSAFLIAKKHNMSLHRLLSLNQLDNASTIYPGQTLVVE